MNQLPNNNPYDQGYLSNALMYNQLINGQTNFANDTDNTSNSNTKIVNLGNGQIQLTGTLAINNGSPTADMVLGALPVQLIPTKDYTLPVAVLRGSTLVQNAIRISSSSSSIIGATVTVVGSYTAIPTLTVVGKGIGASLTALMKGLNPTAIAGAGSGYAPTNTITLTGGTHSAATILTVTNTKLISLALNAAGTGYAVNDFVTLVGVGGTTVTPVIIQVNTLSTSAIATFTITQAGVFTGNPTSFTQASTTGVGSGATFNTPLYGVNSATATTPGSYSVLPSNPVAQGSSSGSGTGATFTMAWGLLPPTVVSGGEGYGTDTTITVSTGSGAMTPLLSNPVTGQIILITAPTNGDVINLETIPFLVKPFSQIFNP